MVPQCPPCNIPKHQVAKTLVEGDEIQDLTYHKRTNKQGDAK
jgi:hypothetical protein